MRGSFKNLSMSTQIGNYPSLMNYNFNVIKNEIDYYFDESLGKLIQSVYVPSGRVDAYWGKFTNLETDHFTITGTNITFDKSFLEELTGHNNLSFRFSYDFSSDDKSQALSSYKDYLSGSTKDVDWEDYYAHDDNLILSTHSSSDFFSRASGSMNGVTIRDELDLVESELSELIHHGNVKDASGDVDLSGGNGDFDDPTMVASIVSGVSYHGNATAGHDEGYIKALDKDIDGYAYSDEIYELPEKVLRKKIKSESDISDILKNRKFIYTRNEYGWLKIDMNGIYAISTKKRGDTVGIILSGNGGKGKYAIRLTENTILTVEGKDASLACIRLIATKISPSTEWKLYSYSGNVKIENL